MGEWGLSDKTPDLTFGQPDFYKVFERCAHTDTVFTGGKVDEEQREQLSSKLIWLLPSHSQTWKLKEKAFRCYLTGQTARERGKI